MRLDWRELGCVNMLAHRMWHALHSETHYFHWIVLQNDGPPLCLHAAQDLLQAEEFETWMLHVMSAAHVANRNKVSSRSISIHWNTRHKFRGKKQSCIFVISSFQLLYWSVWALKVTRETGTENIPTETFENSPVSLRPPAFPVCWAISKSTFILWSRLASHLRQRFRDLVNFFLNSPQTWASSG